MTGKARDRMVSGKASDVAARLSRSLTPPALAAASPEVSSPDESPAVQQQSLSPTERFTVDLSADLNDELARWATQRKRSVGRRVPKTEVVRVLIELLLADPSLATQVEDRLKGNR
jgi:hypothetical protein